MSAIPTGNSICQRRGPLANREPRANRRPMLPGDAGGHRFPETRPDRPDACLPPTTSGIYVTTNATPKMPAKPLWRLCKEAARD